MVEPDEGYYFANWTGNVTTIGDINAAAITITMSAKYSIMANFQEVSPVQYSLTISSTTGGLVTAPGQGTFSYNAGTVVNLVAVPDSGHRFVNWTGNTVTIADINAAVTNITMSGTYSITANFEEIPPVQYRLTINSTEGGNVTTPGEGTFTYGEGTVVILIAEAGEGYWFVEWTGDVDTIANVYAAMTNITMSGNYSIAANFGSEYGNYSDLLNYIITTLPLRVQLTWQRRCTSTIPKDMDRSSIIRVSGRQRRNLQTSTGRMSRTSHNTAQIR